MPRLLAVDTQAGNDDCKKGTMKQWDTIIKKARAANKVPIELKEAYYYHLGVTTAPENKKPANKKGITPWCFSKVVDEEELDKKMKDSALPLRTYSKFRLQGARARQRAASTGQIGSPRHSTNSPHTRTRSIPSVLSNTVSAEAKFGTFSPEEPRSPVYKDAVQVSTI
jgi:hypothetical protein